MDKNKEKSVYINKELHTKIKLFCIRKNLGPMKLWVEKVLDLAMNEPKKKEHAERQAEELTPEEKAMIDREFEASTLGAPRPKVEESVGDNHKIIETENQEIINPIKQESGNMIKVG